MLPIPSGRLALCLTAIIALQWTLVQVSASLDCEALLQEFHELNRQQPAAFTSDSLVFVTQAPGKAAPYLDVCLLRVGIPGSSRCPSFTEHLDAGQISKLPQCRVLSSPDDLSILQSLPNNVAVAAQLQDPVQRLLDAYELTVEIAAQKANKPGQSGSPYERMHRLGSMWPWSKLSDIMLKDMMKREQALDDELDTENWVQLTGKDGSTYYANTFTGDEKDELSEDEEALLLPAVDPYNNKLLMPFKDFVAHPAVSRLLHNGNIFQVLGITNSSTWAKAQDLRKCIRKDATVAEKLLEFAKERVETFAHIGDAGSLHGDAEAAAAALQLPLDGPAYQPGEIFVAGLKKMRIKTWRGGMQMNQMETPAQELEYIPHSATTVEELEKLVADKEAEVKALYDVASDMFTKGERDKAKMMTARARVSDAKGVLLQWQNDLTQMKTQIDLDKQLDANLGAQFLSCASQLDQAAVNATTRAMKRLEMPDGRPIQFRPEAREAIAEATMKDLRRRNALDIKLFEYAKQLMKARREALAAAGKLQQLPVLSLERSTAAGTAHKTEEL